MAVDLFLVAVLAIPVILTACGNAPESGAPPPEPAVAQAAVPTVDPPPRPMLPSPTLRKTNTVAPQTAVPGPATQRPAINAPEDPDQLTTDATPSPASSPTLVPTLSPTVPALIQTVDLARQTARGKRLVERTSCLECHTIDGPANFAPTLAGWFGTVRELEGGDTTIADEDYLRESIQNPNEKMVSGFAIGAMPRVFFSDTELSAVVEYIRSLQ